MGDKYSANFAYAFQMTLDAEGGLSDHPADSGGKTKFGISQGAHPDLDIDKLSIWAAAGIYHKEYWMPLRLDEIESRYVAAEMFDTAVNMGPRWAVRIAQQACNLLAGNSTKIKLKEDGRFGPKTLRRVNELSASAYEKHLVIALNLMQGIRYVMLYKLNEEKYGHFVRGWMKRLEPIFEDRHGK